jgi:hypothetical protein
MQSMKSNARNWWLGGWIVELLGKIKSWWTDRTRSRAAGKGWRGSRRGGGSWTAIWEKLPITTETLTNQDFRRDKGMRDWVGPLALTTTTPNISDIHTWFSLETNTRVYKWWEGSMVVPGVVSARLNACGSRKEEPCYAAGAYSWNWVPSVALSTNRLAIPIQGIISVGALSANSIRSHLDTILSVSIARVRGIAGSWNIAGATT